jgi:DNA-directed RNA polymerase subunit M/transcription elongation factor TFIIS
VITRLDDHRDSEGNLDWRSYHASEVEAGEKCTKCGKFIFPAKGHPARCYDCKSLMMDDGEVDHHSYIRCPKCGDEYNVWDTAYYEILTEETHEVMCQSCEHEFEIETRVEYTFTSPAKEA